MKKDYFQGLVGVSTWLGLNSYKLYYVVKGSSGFYSVKELLSVGTETVGAYIDSNNNIYLGSNGVQNYFVIGFGNITIEYDVQVADVSTLTPITTT